MALTRDQKAAQLVELKEKLAKAHSVIFCNYIGLTVAKVSDLRKKLREAGAEMKVAKKTLMTIATKEAGLPEIDEKNLPGPVAAIFGFEDPIVGAQIAHAFSKDNPQIAFLGGIFDKKLMTKEQAKAFALIPGRQVLLATFAAQIRSPLQKFAGICASPLSGFARAVSELSKKKASA